MASRDRGGASFSSLACHLAPVISLLAGARTGTPNKSNRDAAPPLATGGIAVRYDVRHVSASTGAIVACTSLRRRDVVLRRLEYRSLVVDEALLARGFPVVASPLASVACVVLEGRVAVGDGLVAEAGSLVVYPRDALSRIVWDDALVLELEWRGSPRPAEVAPVPAETLPALRALALLLGDADAPRKLVLAYAFDVFARLGVAHGLEVDRLRPDVDPRDGELVEALGRRFHGLASSSDVETLVDDVGISPRHAQRAVRKVCTDYRLSGSSWRDLRNRWRVQLAAVLLGTGRAPVGVVAAEVGYASGAALARAFAELGLPRPQDLVELAQSTRRAAFPQPTGKVVRPLNTRECAPETARFSLAPRPRRSRSASPCRRSP